MKDRVRDGRERKRGRRERGKEEKGGKERGMDGMELLLMGLEGECLIVRTWRLYTT